MFAKHLGLWTTCTIEGELGHHNYYHYCQSDSKHADLDLKIADSVYAFVFLDK